MVFAATIGIAGDSFEAGAGLRTGQRVGLFGIAWHCLGSSLGSIGYCGFSGSSQGAENYATVGAARTGKISIEGCSKLEEAFSEIGLEPVGRQRQLWDL